MGLISSLNKITALQNISFQQKVERLLRLGCSSFGLTTAIVSEVIGERYIVRYVQTPDNSLPRDTEFPLGNTYCVHTLKANDIVAFEHAGNSEISQHPCYLTFGLESYVGAPLYVDGVCYGTVNFSSLYPRTVRFSEDEFDYVRLLTQWIGNEISRQRTLTQMVAQQQQMAHQQELMKAIGDLARIGAWEVDVLTGKVSWSDVTRDIHEVSDDFQPSLRNLAVFLKSEKDRQEFKHNIKMAIEKGHAWASEYELVTANGRHLWVAIRGRAEFKQGYCVRLYGALQDINSQVLAREALKVKMQEAEDALQARGRFLANMSHEIRTPMNGVLGMLQSLSATQLDGRQQQLCTVGMQSAKTLLALINDILDFSKIDSGKMLLEAVPFELSQLLRSTMQPFYAQATAKGITLREDFSQLPAMEFIGDPVRVSQILNNLLSNAVKFTAKGSVEISARLARVADDASRIHIFVRDTGIGIDENTQRQLFNPFVQADTSTTRHFGGTGLGLTISRHLAELMGGKILLQSEKGAGSEFKVVLQLKNAQTLTPAPTLADDRLISGDGTLVGKRVLLVEDNEINQMVVEELLSTTGVTLDMAHNGLDALEKVPLAMPAYDLILMDCQMPEMDGYEATRALRSMGQTLPIIALTAHAMVGEKEKCLDAGMDDYLTKPIEAEKLQLMLHGYLGKSQVAS